MRELLGGPSRRAFSVREIATTLRRSEEAVETRLRRLGWRCADVDYRRRG